MHRIFCALILLTGFNVTIDARCQMKHAVPGQPGSLDVAVTYASDHARLAPGKCGCFWLHGGSADAALTLWNGVGISASIAGDQIANYAPGIDFNKITYLAGPRYTWSTRHRDADYGRGGSLEFFGEALFGVVHAFNGEFPSGTGVTTSANSFALQTGGGIVLPISQHLGLRVAQAEYVRTRLPNGFANTQNDLRLSAGVVLRLGSVGNRRF